MADHDTKLDTMTKQLIAAGLIELFTDVDGDQAMRLAPRARRWRGSWP